MNDKPASSRRGFLASFADLRTSPRAFWFVIGAFVVEAMAYFGILTLMTSYLSTDLGWGDKWAGATVSVFTMLVTLFMLGLGSYAESFGLRRAIIFALLISTAGRGIYSLACGWQGALAVAAVMGSLLIVAAGSAILQPVCYSGVKQYTDEKTNAMGYGLIYAIMNLGIVGIGTLSAWVRPGVQNIKDAATGGAEQLGQPFLEALAARVGSGVQAVNWLCMGLTALTLVLFVVLMSKKAEAAKLRPDPAEKLREKSNLPFLQRLWNYFADGPFKNPRFIFFIFMLLPVRTLFAHQWLTMPQYIMRSYDKDVADHMEWLINWINPAIIFIGVPVLTALTRHVHVYRMMLLGTLVSAAPTFLLCLGARLDLLITYFVLFSIGEALWSARFYEYASELAPPGRVAQFMGLANIPWLLAKGTTGFYSGVMLARYCPADAPRGAAHPETMWLVYGIIAMTTPVGLWLARKWVMAGLHSHAVKGA